MRQRTGWKIAAIIAMLICGAWGGEAWAVNCAALGANAQQTPGLCTILGPITAPCPLTLDVPAGDDLLITGAGSLRCDNATPTPSSITINLAGGDMTMQAGSKITVEDNAAGGATDGGDVTITVNGNFLMQGTGSATDPDAVGCADVAGACISSSDVLGGSPGKAGNVTITVGNYPNSTTPVGVFTMQPGSAVLANGVSGGEIIVTAGQEMHIDGLIRSFGRIGGTGSGQPNGGGPITIKSGCVLEVTPDGVISSEGENPGADLVHLEGCEVTINGLVQSIALGNGGHAFPDAGNRCNADPVAHPLGGAEFFTACVEIWGNNITINSVLPNKGEVSADGIARHRAWIDLFAKINITINNDATGPYSVHANSANTTGDFGGVLTSKAQTGAFTSSGLAFQANSTTAGGDGGNVTIQASANVNLTDSSVEARGSAAGTAPAGGTISGRSFNGFLLGNAPGALIATGGNPPNGVITLQGCGTIPVLGDGVNYTGATNPAATIAVDACGGQPALPAAAQTTLDNVLAPICASNGCGVGECSKSGRKFNDVNNNGQDDGEPGLSGWQICSYDNTGTLKQCLTTDVNGNYEFSSQTGGLICGQPFTFCEVLQAGWNQTFPTLPSADPSVVSCAGLVGPGGLPLGPVGYRETIPVGQTSSDNDFGNFLPPPDGECPKFPNLDVDKTIIIDPDDPTQIQTAINGLDLGETLLILPHLGTKTENIVINKSVHVVGCSITLTAKTVGTPVVTIGAGAADGSTTDVHATGSTVAGYQINGSNHLVKNVRAFDNAIGFHITSGATGNRIVGAQGTVDNGTGILIEGDGNTVDSASGVTNNTGVGALISSQGSGNTIKKSTFIGNGLQGIRVDGTGNTISENKAYSNGQDGILVTGGGNQLLKNIAGEKDKGNGQNGISVTGNTGPLTQNTARDNGTNGFSITGTGHVLTKNVGGGTPAQENSACQFVIVAGNMDGGDNKANNTEFTFTAAGNNCVGP